MKITPPFMTVSPSLLNLRAEPTVKGRIIAKLPKDHPVHLVTDKAVNGFLEVETEVGDEFLRGFASASFLTPAGSPQDNAGVTEKPLIFISASHKDVEWRQLLERALDSHSAYVEWWDDSKIKPGSRWEPEIAKAIERARVAVLLLSPAYLDSRNAIAEIARLRMRLASTLQTLFPIVVQECNWWSVTEIRDIQVWANGTPLEGLSANERAAELGKIAAAIVSSLGITVGAEQKPPEQVPEIEQPPALPPDVDFSLNAQRVWQKAQWLATSTRRGRVTSSCLLFGFAESATEEPDCAWFVRTMLAQTGNYETAFKQFYEDGAADDQADRDVAQIGGQVSRNVAAVLEYAKTIASTITPGTNEIHQRHLLAALLNPPGRKGKLKAHKRMKEIGIERSRYLAEFGAFIGTAVPSEAAGWKKFLKFEADDKSRPPKQSSPFVSGPAGYTSEFCGVGSEESVSDDLLVGPYADRLADLIALKETKLPLAIGLFGNWGSGKSHFMNLIDQRLKDLKEEEKKRPPDSKQKWAREIVPIYFNAWHYLDTNLWASLVSHIFERLFLYLRPKQDDLATVQKLLEEASGATARAAEEVSLAKAATEQARIEVSVAEEKRRDEQTAMDALFRSLKSLLPGTENELHRQVADVLGGSRAVETLNDLKSVSRDARTFGNRVKRSWNNLFKQPGRQWRITWLVVTLLVVPAVAALVAMSIPQEWFGQFRRSIAPIIAALPPLIGWAAYILKKGHRQLDRIDDWIAQARAAQQQHSETPEIREGRMKVTAALAREEAARSRLVEAEVREQELVEEARELHPERRLGRYIEQRAQSSDYRGQLGLVSLARRDFQELSDLFANTDAVTKRLSRSQEKCDDTKKRAVKLRASKTGKDLKQDADIEKEAKELDDQADKLTEEIKRIENVSNSIDRIVLFVDDLDRCQPEKIVEILQAVHLLLAFPLFAVVVGVDQRALRQSLRMQFKGLLSQEAQTSNGNQAKAKQQEMAERAATPLDYLEKIFHVPFHLPVMGKDGFERLIDTLTEPRKPEQQNETKDKETPPGNQKEGQPMAPAQPKPHSPAVTTPVLTPTLTQPSVIARTPASEVVTGRTSVLSDLESTGHATGVSQPVETELVGSVPLQDWERKALRDYHTLIQTPRGAKRLLNTYRLVRAGVPKDEWDHFAAGEYRVAMLLLAAAAGYPATARAWFAQVMKSDWEDISGEVLDERALEGWNNFERLYQENPDQPDRQTLSKWITRVETFTF